MLSREVTDAEVNSAQLQNRWNAYNQLGSASAGLMRQASTAGLHPDSPAYDRLLNSLSGAEDSLRSQGRDPYRNADDSMAAVRSLAPQVLSSPTVRAAYRAMGMDVPEPQRQAPRQAAGPIWNAGEVNGLAVMAPTQGNYGAVLEHRGRMGLSGTTDLGLDEYNQRQDELAAQGLDNPEMTYQQQAAAGRTRATAAAEAARRDAERKEADAEREHQRNLDLERLKLGGKGYNEKDMIKFHEDELGAWQKDQQRATELEQMAAGARVDPVTGQAVVMTREGGVIPANVLKAQAKALRRPQPTYADSLNRLGIPESQQRAQELLASASKLRGERPTYADSLEALGTPASLAHAEALRAGQPKPQPEKNWLQRGVEQVGGLMERGQERQARLQARQQAMASWDADDLARLQAATLKQQEKIFELMGL